MVIERQLTALQVGSGALLEAVRIDSQTVRLIFSPQIKPAEIAFVDGTQVTQSMVLNGYPCLSCRLAEGQDDLQLVVQNVPLSVRPAPAEYDLFAGRNVLLAERNGESADIVFDWLAYHITHHGASGAIILDRARPHTDAQFLHDLTQKVAVAAWDCPVVVLSSELPLGKPDLPAESHPLNVPESPGKDRMQVPPADPWAAPLGFPLFYEAMRYRFVAQARAVANIDVHDILTQAAPSIFDLAQASDQGVVTLIGRHCFPWRVRNEEHTHFSDHLCVQFDKKQIRQRWCVAPAKLPDKAFWMILRLRNVELINPPQATFYRCMALRHPTESVSLIVPKTSLVEDPDLLALMQEVFDANPVRIPDVELEPTQAKNGRRAIVTCMKNEGPFILEWLAYHRAIGFQDFLIYTNDCEDGTDAMFDLLQAKGLVEHRENPYRKGHMKPQHAALHAADKEPVITDAEWVACIDVDEFINIKVGDGTLDALFAAAPKANMIAMTWRLFGNSDLHDYREGFVTEQFLRCAPEFANKPHQAWGFKTLFQHIGIFKKLGVHRPKGLNPQLWEKINWINGSGAPLPEKMFRNAWRSDSATYGYDLVQLNHYAVRSVESFLVKRDRGRVNHVDRDQGLAYWFRMNNNAVEDRSILPRLEAARAEYDRLLADPEIRAMHAACVAHHRAKIDALLEADSYADFYHELTDPRMEKLSRLHAHFGANVFLQGPGVVPDEIVAKDPDEEFFFTVEEGKTIH